MSGVIDLTSDDESTQNRPSMISVSDEEDEDLKLAIALSLQDQDKTEHTNYSPNEVDQNPQVPSKSEKPPASSLLNLDRKAMEAERLARLKRKRDPDIQESRQQPTTTLSSRISPPPPRRQKRNSPPRTPASTAKLASNPTIATFPHPEILLTSQPSRRGPQGRYTSISLSDILLPPTSTHTLKSALLSSFIADLDWALPHFDTRSTTFLFILHAQNAQHRALLTSDFAGLPNVKLLLPETLGAGNMHSKLMLLFYQSTNNSSGASSEVCRVVIPSANLIPADWGVGDVMENVLFAVDLPLKENTTAAATADINTAGFEKKLKQMLQEMEVPTSVLQKLERFDFRVTTDIGFVYSRSGSNLLDSLTTNIDADRSAKAAKKRTGEGFFEPKRGKKAQTRAISADDLIKRSTEDMNDPARTGLLSLQDAVVSLGLDVPSDDPSQQPQLDFITSSLGNLTPSFVRQLYLAVCGRLDPTKVVGPSKRVGAKATGDDASLDAVIKEKLKIYFPTGETVQHSKGGPGAAGTICFQRKWWEANELIRDCLHDCVGARGDGILMHSKILYVRFKTPKIIRDKDLNDRTYAGWAYVGSANLSESAWGRVVSDAKSQQPKLTCRNWESGIVIPVEVPKAAREGHSRGQIAGEIGQQVGKGGWMNRRSSKGVTSNAGQLWEATIHPTSVEESAPQTGVRKDTSTTHLPGQSKSDGLAMEHAMEGSDAESQEDATPAGQPKDVGKHLGIPSLSEVFMEVLPVPIRHPAPSHVARQQKPWFFME